jgi:hypothetical protein
MTRSSQFIEYMKLHLISLEQDLEKSKSDEATDEEYFGADTYYEGAMDTVKHLLSVATDIMNSSNERYTNE